MPNWRAAVIRCPGDPVIGYILTAAAAFGYCAECNEHNPRQQNRLIEEPGILRQILV